MSQSDCMLTFPSIPLSFGLSSDLASGWSKLVYEQVLTNKSKIEVEILGLGPQEAHVVEEAVKLLFGFKIAITHLDLVLFLKVSDMLGLTQSPLSPANVQTLQEQILEYCIEHIGSINLVEAWDYGISILETEPYTIHRNEIRKLGMDMMSRLKGILRDSRFEVITNYSPNQSNKFSLKEMKRENYIQLRSFFFNYVNNEQKTHLNQVQNLVKVLFDEMDKHFELDGYINKYIENITSQMEELKERISA